MRKPNYDRAGNARSAANRRRRRYENARGTTDTTKTTGMSQDEIKRKALDIVNGRQKNDINKATEDVVEDSSKISQTSYRTVQNVFEQEDKFSLEYDKTLNKYTSGHTLTDEGIKNEIEYLKNNASEIGISDIEIKELEDVLYKAKEYKEFLDNDLANINKNASAGKMYNEIATMSADEFNKFKQSYEHYKNIKANQNNLAAFIDTKSNGVNKDIANFIGLDVNKTDDIIELSNKINHKIAEYEKEIISKYGDDILQHVDDVFGTFEKHKNLQTEFKKTVNAPYRRALSEAGIDISKSFDEIGEEAAKKAYNVFNETRNKLEKMTTAADDIKMMKIGKKFGKYALGALALYGIVQMLHEDKGMDNSQLYSQTPII